jgi:TonB family protein
MGQTAARDHGQDIERVRSLYVSAAYEEALAAMPPVGGTAVTTDLEQYRALCLIALGREQEAVAAVERLVNDHPMFVPRAADTSPRMQSVFMATRSRLVPAIAKRQYGEAKASYELKDVKAAREGFQRTLDLIGSLPDADKDSLADLRLLAAEFLDLAATRAAAPVLAAPAPVTPPVPTAPAPTLPPSRPEPPAEYVPPSAIRERLPSWIPPNTDAMRTTYVGMLRVSIGEDGRVVKATLVKSTHPAYDAVVLVAAKDWLYKPATRGGKPVLAQRDILVRLNPR